MGKSLEITSCPLVFLVKPMPVLQSSDMKELIFNGQLLFLTENQFFSKYLICRLFLLVSKLRR